MQIREGDKPNFWVVVLEVEVGVSDTLPVFSQYFFSQSPAILICRTFGI